MEYIGAKSEKDLEKYIISNGLDTWGEIVCESEVFNGNFYTDSNEICTKDIRVKEVR